MSRAWRLPGSVVFAGTFHVWDPQGCGAAFYFPDLDMTSTGRAWLVTTEQFMDIVAQENGHEAGALDAEVAPAPAGGAPNALIGTGAYNLMLRCGETEGVPAWMFTTSAERNETHLNAPSNSYLYMLATGLSETAGLDVSAAQSYLRGLPGAT